MTTADPVERARWLVRTEPTAYAFDDLVREGRTAWTGVKNALAQRHLRAFVPGDLVLVHHTGRERAIVGVARVVGAPFPDPTAPGTRQACVELEAVAALARPLPLAGLRTLPALARFELLTNPRLSVLPVPPAAARALAAAARRG